MEKTSVEKLMKDGYVFLRKEDSTNAKTGKTTPIIKCSDEFGVWKKHSEYKTKKERNRYFDFLLRNENDKYIG